MSYDKRIKSQGKLYCHQNAGYKISGETLVAYRSVQIYFTAMATGVITVTGEYNMRQPGTYNNVYIGTTEEINTETGIPTSYLATGQNTLTFTVAVGTTYVATVQGITGPVDQEYGLLSISANYSSYNYVPVMKSLIDNAYGTVYFNYCSFQNNQTYIYPIKFATNMNVRFYVPSSYNNGVYVAVSNSYSGINTDGTPVAATIISMTGPHLRPSFTATAGTTYYLYFKVISSRGTYNSVGAAIACAAVSGAASATIITTIKDYYGTTQGEVTDYVVQNDNLSAQYKNIGNERVICWMPKNLDLTNPYGNPYKRMKFIGWYSRSDYRYDSLLSTCPEYRFCPTSSSTTIYGLVQGEETDFNFTSTIATGQPFKIEASEWNDFVTYCAYKYNKDYGRQQQLYTHFGYDLSASLVGQISCYIKTGDRLLALAYNKMKYYGLDRAVSSPLPPTNLVYSGNRIYASYINNLLAEAKAL